jgi:hypothetical protein
MYTARHLKRQHGMHLCGASPYGSSSLDLLSILNAVCNMSCRAKSLDPAAGGMEVGYAYWSGVSMGLVNPAHPSQAIVNWQVTL